MSNIPNKARTLLQVGEVSDDRIGCYLFGVEMPDGSSPSYHSLATSRQELLEDCSVFFNELETRKRELIMQATPTAPRHMQDLKVINNAIDNLALFIDMHIKQSDGKPFLQFAGMHIFLRKGERERQKVNGSYIE